MVVSAFPGMTVPLQVVQESVSHPDMDPEAEDTDEEEEEIDDDEDGITSEPSGLRTEWSKINYADAADVETDATRKRAFIHNIKIQELST